MTMLGSVGTDNFNVDDIGGRAPCNLMPSAARDREGIYGIGNDRSAEAQIVFGDRVRGAVAKVSDVMARLEAGTQRAFDGVDAQM